MKTILITVVLAACAALGGAAMPTKEESERAEPLVRKLMASERAALASGKKTRSEVAAAALKLAGETDTEAAKLLLMKGAFVLYVKDGNLEKAVETMNTLEKAIADVPPQCVTNMIETALLGASKKDDGVRLYRLLDAAKENAGEASPPPHDGEVVHKQATVDGYTWSYRVNNGEATIEAMKDGKYVCAVSPNPTGDVVIPSTLNGVKVTSVGREVFCYCSGPKSVRIPEGVENVGWCAFYNCTNLVAVTLPQSLKSIGHGAFAGCCGLTEVTIPACVTNIDADAFLACTKIKSIAIPSGVKCIKGHAFDLCSGLTQVAIPSSVESIGRQAFFNCKGLKSLTISSGVKSIDSIAFANCDELAQVVLLGERPKSSEDVFQNCPKLKEIHVPANAKSWAGIKEWQGIPLVFDGKETVDGYSWSYCVRNGEAEIVAEKDGTFLCALSPNPKGAVTIPSALDGKRVTHIGQSAFKGCSGMSSVTIPSDVKKIGPRAFEGCSGLTSIAIPDGVTTIEGCVFSGCGGLMSVMIPPSVTTISDAAFVYCDGLTSMTIPPTVKELRTQVFFCCRALESVTIPASVEKIGWAAFAYSGELNEINVEEGNRWFTSVDGVLYTKDMTELVACPNAQTSLMIPSSVKKLRDAAIIGCGKLESLTIPEGVTDIGWQAIKDCVSLKTVTIPSTVGSIAEIAFWNCRSLTSVTIPVGVVNIGKRAFENCVALTSVTMLCERPNAPDDVFNGCGKLKAIRVPVNAKSWAGMKTWQGIPLVFDANLQVAKERTTVQSIIDGMIKVPGRDYWLSATEVTQGQWEAVMGYNISTHKGANLPVENVSRDECAVFFEKLNETKEVLLTRFEFGLPTLVEWTYAAQAGGSELDCWIKPGVVGDVFDMAWVAENSSNQTHVVATKAANAFGFYDMLGNVWEWMDCKEENVGCRHGGSFRDPAADCTVRKGYHNPRNRRFDCYGLRVAAHIRSAVEVCPDEK